MKREIKMGRDEGNLPEPVNPAIDDLGRSEAIFSSGLFTMKIFHVASDLHKEGKLFYAEEWDMG